MGEGGEKSDTYRAYEILRDTAPAGLLVRLTSDKNTVVRCYAFRALAAKHADVDLFEIFWGHRNDFAEVRTFRGCRIGTEKVADVMIEDARERFTGEQDRRLLEHLLRTKSSLSERSRLLRSTTVPADLIPELRRLADGGDEDALIALARHRRPEDMARIEARLRAQERRVHPDLLPALEAAALHRDSRPFASLRALAPRVHTELRKKTPARYRVYFKALAAQPSPQAAELLASFLDLDGLSRYTRGRMGEVLFEVIRASAAAGHVALLWRLWEERAQLDATVARRLFAMDAKRARSGVARDLQADPNRLPGDAMATLLTLLAESDRDAAVRLVSRALSAADVGHFDAFARLAGLWKADGAVAPLLRAYRTQTNPHIYLSAAYALLAYNQPELDRDLDDGVREIEHLGRGWGGKRLRELLTARPRDGGK